LILNWQSRIHQPQHGLAHYTNPARDCPLVILPVVFLDCVLKRGDLINARSETLKEKSAFRGTLQKGRCLVLADGFYEWGMTSGKKSVPGGA